MEIIIRDSQKAAAFSMLFQNVKVFTELINISFDDSQMFIQAMDAANVTVFEVKLEKEWFDEYTMNESFTMGVNTNIMSKILSTREKDQHLTMSATKGADDVEIVFSGNDKSFNKEFVMPQVDNESDHLGIPDSESNAIFSMPSVTFNSLIQQLRMFGESATIKCDENEISMTANSTETGKMKVVLEQEKLDEYAIDEGEDLEMSFTLNYLSNIAIFNKVAPTVEVNLTKDYPMKIVFYLDEKCEMSRSIAFYLAPQIDLNED